MHIRSLVPALALLLGACGQPANPTELTNSGFEALRSGNQAAAEKDFERALEAVGHDVVQPIWLRAKMGLIEARTHTDPARAKAEFLELAKTQPSKVTDEDFSVIGRQLAEAGKLAEAVEVVTAGTQMFPESPHLGGLIDKLGDMAQASGDSEELDALKGLGYVGD